MILYNQTDLGILKIKNFINIEMKSQIHQYSLYTSLYIYKYNKLDKLICEVEYDKFEKVVNQKYIEYDKKGNLIKNASTRHDDEEYETTAIDEQGNWTEITISTLGFIDYIKHREIEYFQS